VVQVGADVRGCRDDPHLLAMTGKIVWALGIVAWYVIRYPFERQAKRLRVVGHFRSLAERVGLVAATTGLGVIPGFYVVTGAPRWADYPPRLWAVPVGAVVYAAALWLFRRSHKDLGKNWSITLEIRDQHRVVSEGVYALIRHPMYTAFWLMGLGQAFLLPNWFAGLSGLVGTAVLFFLRVEKEEQMMLDTFGEEYRAYMGRTKRIIPRIY
jgi:protein-S-isoprenylcysteine O-methyltransferase Ste14